MAIHVGEYQEWSNRDYLGSNNSSTICFQFISSTLAQRALFWELILDSLMLNTKLINDKVYVSFVPRAQLPIQERAGLGRIDGTHTIHLGKSLISIAEEIVDPTKKPAFFEVVTHELAHVMCEVCTFDPDDICDLFGAPHSAWEHEVYQQDVEEAWCEVMKDLWLDVRDRTRNNNTDLEIPKAKWYGPNEHWAANDQANWYNGFWNGVPGWELGSDPDGNPWHAPMPDLYDYTGSEVWPVYRDMWASRGVLSDYPQSIHPPTVYPYDVTPGGGLVPGRIEAGDAREGMARS